MKHTSANQSRQARTALAVLAGFAALGVGSAQAAAQFVDAGISIVSRGEEKGGIECGWRETGLASSQVVYYACTSGAVAALKACTYKNRVIYQSPSRLDVFYNVVGEHGTVPFLAQKNGQINASTITPVPQVETAEGQELCTAPSLETVIAARWCNASLTDVTNGNLLGVAEPELFARYFTGVGDVPACGAF